MTDIKKKKKKILTWNSLLLSAPQKRHQSAFTKNYSWDKAIAQDVLLGDTGVSATLEADCEYHTPVQQHPWAGSLHRSSANIFIRARHIILNTFKVLKGALDSTAKLKSYILLRQLTQINLNFLWFTIQETKTKKKIFLSKAICLFTKPQVN